jgi:hypothetical protein
METVLQLGEQSLYVQCFRFQIENRVMRIFGPKRDEVEGGWRRPHDEELHNLYASPDIIRVIKSRRM